MLTPRLLQLDWVEVWVRALPTAGTQGPGQTELLSWMLTWYLHFIHQQIFSVLSPDSMPHLTVSHCPVPKPPHVASVPAPLRHSSIVGKVSHQQSLPLNNSLARLVPGLGDIWKKVISPGAQTFYGRHVTTAESVLYFFSILPPWSLRVPSFIWAGNGLTPGDYMELIQHEDPKFCSSPLWSLLPITPKSLLRVGIKTNKASDLALKISQVCWENQESNTSSKVW